MNAWERGSSWRHRLLIGWLALGWIVALLLVCFRSLAHQCSPRRHKYDQEAGSDRHSESIQSDWTDL